MGIIVGSKSARANAGVGNTTTVGQYTVHQFTTNGNFTPATTGFIDILLVGGGGNGGVPINSGSGGAGATLFKKMIPVTASTPYPVVVGGSGGNSTFTYSGITTTAFAGGAGGNGNVNHPAFTPVFTSPGYGTPAPNASGGGGGNNTGVGGNGAGITGIGYPGGTGGSPAPNTTGGGGGGAGGAGGNGSTSPGAGGPGVPITYFTGISTDIASVGGTSAFPGSGITSTSYGSGGGGPGGPGRPGVAYIRYI